MFQETKKLKQLASLCQQGTSYMAKPFRETVCVLVNYAAEGTPAPIIVGDTEENTVLKSGMFFVLPVKILFYYFYSPNKKNVQLTQFTG